MHPFPSLAHGIFFDHAAVAPIPLRAAEAMGRAAMLAAQGKHADQAWYREALRVRQLGARMVGARGPHEIAFIPNTSTGLATLALAGFRGRGWHTGDHVVCLANDFPANRLPWLNLRNQGVKVDEVMPDGQGLVGTQAIVNAITNHTRIVAIPHVVYSTGEKLDLAAISQVAHQAGAWLCVDAIQSVGAMPVDVVKDGVDFLVADGHKWMLGPEGAGILYCHEDLAPQLPPPIVGWMNRENPLDFDGAGLRWQPDARRFEPGTWNVIGLHGLAGALDVLLEEGLEQVWRKIDALNLRLRAGLLAKNHTLISPRQESKRSGIVAFQPPGAPNTPAGLLAIQAQLKAKNIRLAVRAGCLRASPHFYNTDAQVDAVLAALCPRDR